METGTVHDGLPDSISNDWQVDQIHLSADSVSGDSLLSFNLNYAANGQNSLFFAAVINGDECYIGRRWLPRIRLVNWGGAISNPRITATSNRSDVPIQFDLAINGIAIPFDTVIVSPTDSVEMPNDPFLVGAKIVFNFDLSF